jgi:hypothetical protein
MDVNALNALKLEVIRLVLEIDDIELIEKAIAMIKEHNESIGK